MAKSILISIKPRYVADILNNKKTIEVRKSMPKCDLPIDVYIYCTKDNKANFVKECWTNTYTIYAKEVNYASSTLLNGKVVAKFTLNKVEEMILPYTYFETGEYVKFEEERKWQTPTMNEDEILKLSCLTEPELYEYLVGKNKGAYAWHISNLVIFDKPKELSEFYRVCNKCPFKNSQVCFDHCGEDICKITKAPQSMCYVEVSK